MCYCLRKLRICLLVGKEGSRETPPEGGRGIHSSLALGFSVFHIRTPPGLASHK